MSIYRPGQQLNKTDIDQRINTLKGLSSGEKYSYDYNSIAGIDNLKPGSEVHDKLKDMILRRANASQKAYSSRHDLWGEMDRVLTTYIEIDDDEKRVLSEDSRKPVSIIIPVSYAILDTIMTYYSAAFLEEPYFRYDGTGPEDVRGAKKLELAVAYQCRRAKVGLALRTMWRSGLAYGFGISYVNYETTMGWRTREVQENVFSMFVNKFIPGRKQNMREYVPLYSGSRLDSIDSYKVLPDPDVPIYEVQKMAYFGWIDRTNLMSLLSTEKDNPDMYFNVQYLKHVYGVSQFNKEEDTTGRADKTQFSADQGTSGVNRIIDVIPMYIRIIPKDWGLGNSEYPEIYLFELAADSVIIRAQPLGLDHNMIPIAVNAPEYDGFSISPISRLETVQGMQKYLDWLHRSRMTNVRKTLYGMTVIDPRIINMHDVKKPGAGKLLRLRRDAYGKGVKDGIMQLDVQDVTSGYVGEIEVVKGWANSLSGAQDIVQGLRRNSSADISATEAAGTMQAAMSRLSELAKVTSMMAHYDIAYQMAWNTKQMMEDETFYKIIGDYDEGIFDDMEMGRVPVSPKDLNIDFDVSPHDGTVPGSGNPAVWVQMMQAISQNEALVQEIDLVKMFKYWARMAGAKNINDFVRNKAGNANVQVVPDQQVQSMEQSGQVIPTQGVV
jgi:hypothetical protein